MPKSTLEKIVLHALEESKANDIVDLDVRKLTDIADAMVICSGTSRRHLNTIAEYVVEHAKAAGFKPLGVEGEKTGEWILIDLVDVIVHVMLPKVRAFYDLEKLWGIELAKESRG